MSGADYESAVAAYLRKKTITRCPTVCVLPTQASVAEKDRAAYRAYVETREAARLKRSQALQQMIRG